MNSLKRAVMKLYGCCIVLQRNRDRESRIEINGGKHVIFNGRSNVEGMRKGTNLICRLQFTLNSLNMPLSFVLKVDFFQRPKPLIVPRIDKK